MTRIRVVVSHPDDWCNFPNRGLHRLNSEVERLTESFQADRYPRERGYRPLNSHR